MSIWRPAKRVDVEVPVARLFRVGEPQGTAWRTEPRPEPGSTPCAEGDQGQDQSATCDAPFDSPRVTAFDAAFRRSQPAAASPAPDIAISTTPADEVSPAGAPTDDDAGEEAAPVSIPSAWPWAEPAAASVEDVREEPTMDEPPRPYWEVSPPSPEPAQVAVAIEPASPEPGSPEPALVDDWKQTELVARLIVGLSEFRTLLNDVPDAALGQAVRQATARELGGVTRTLATLMAEDYRSGPDASPGMDRLEWLLSALAESGADGGRMDGVRPLLAEVRERSLPR